MNVFRRHLLLTRLPCASSIIRPTRCRALLSSRLKADCQAQRFASFRPSPQSEDQQTDQKRAAEVFEPRRRVAQAGREASPAGSEDGERRDVPFSDADVARYYNQPISWKPLFVGLGMCVAAFLAAEAIDGRADEQAFQDLARSGLREGTIQDAKRTIAANTVSALTLIDDIFGTDTAVLIRWWARATRSDGDRAAVIIIATNAAVFLAWVLASRVPALSYRMGTSFVHFPGVTSSYTLLTSVFSHQVRWHSLH